MPPHVRTLLYTIGLFLWFCQPVTAQQLATTKPENVGLSSDRLQHLTRIIEQNVEEDLLAGCVVLLARNGEIAYLKAAGMQDREAGILMKENTIFRNASMTKPITSVAVMMLY